MVREVESAVAHQPVTGWSHLEVCLTLRHGWIERRLRVFNMFYPEWTGTWQQWQLGAA